MSSEQRRTAVVTGSAQGIGAAISRAFRARGVTVIGVDRQLDRESDVYIQADLSDWDVVMEVAERTRDADILVNNAAILIQRPVADYVAEDFELLHNINLRAPFLLCREAGAAMFAQRGIGRSWGGSLPVLELPPTVETTGEGCSDFFQTCSV